MKEGSIQSSIKKELEKQGWFVTKIIQCSTNGFPDLMALKDGRVMFVECKTPKGVVSPLQAYRIEQLRKLGFEVIVATSKSCLNERPITDGRKKIHKSGDLGSSNR